MDFSTTDRSRQLILEVLPSGADVTLVLCGDLVSDELAASGARALLAETPHRELRLDELASARGQTALLLGTGFSRDDHDVMPRALAVAELRFERVVVLPASFDCSDETVRRALSRTKATVFAREPDSFEQIKDLGDARLAHDCSFFFDFAPYVRAGEGTLEEDISLTAPDLEAWLELIGVHHVVRTARAHVMIAAALMGKEVKYRADSEFGVDSIARHALGDRHVVRMISGEERPVEPANLDAETEATVAMLSTAAITTPPPRPPDSDIRVTAVVLTRDRPSLLLRALASIEESQVPVHTLVIDNNSAQPAVEAVAAICRGRSSTTLTRSEHNLGCSGGRRLGSGLADTEFVFFLDDDAELMPGALDHLLYELDRHPEADAVTATVVRSDGTVLHSGGPMDVADEIVTFGLLGDGASFPTSGLPPSGPSGWTPGGAMLARRTLLEEFPLNETMGAYFEDNEWCYRISKARPGKFRRSREALVVHHTEPKHPTTSDFASRSRMAEVLASYARFYHLHDRLLGPWLFDHIPSLRADDGSCDLAAARLLMELVLAKGTDWIFMEWMNGDLSGLLEANRRFVKLRAAESVVDPLKARVARDASTIASLDARLNTATRELERVKTSVTWQLFQRVRARVFALLGGEESRAVAMLQRGLRILGRGLPSGASRGQGLSSFASSPHRRAGAIRFAPVSEPEVSIVIPLHAHAELTEAALWSIYESTRETSYEVILVDDSEDPPTKALLGRVHGARMITNETNLGYLRSIKRGAEAARGHWLVLCNNDIEVQPGWLLALLDCAKSHPDVAVITPKYIYPDGTLAEAGGVVWRDGTGANYGRGEPPDGCHYEYRREVDYGSAAALMVRADFWREAGGFDERFEPMYYEDTDLCFEAHSRGLRVMYEPRAHVVHVEGATAGVDESAGHKRHQELNRPKFVQKWCEVLETQHLANDRGNLWLAANRHRDQRVLVVDHRVPTWDRDSGGLRMRAMLEALLELGCHVSLLPDNGLAMQPYTRELQRLGVEVLYGSHGHDLRREVARIAPSLSLTILSRAKVADHWLRFLRDAAPTVPTVFDTVDLHWLREARAAAFGNGASLAATASAMRELEVRLISAADATLVVTEEERSHVLADVPRASVHVVPNVHLVRAVVEPPARRSGLVFVGGFEHPPNVDAALMLVREVMPLVWRELASASLEIVGADAPAEIEALGSGLVDVRGWVPDLEPVLASARAMVAPLTYGAGLKGKVTQALAYGLPVVTTPIGAEGLDAVDGEHMLIGETPEELADRVVRVLCDDESWHRLSSAGQRLIGERCSPELMRERLSHLLDELRPAPAPVTRTPVAA
jgi:GT2 family glycosyltransferase/glycosyltransferase involved in cell wall biosynthesis